MAPKPIVELASEYMWKEDVGLKSRNKRTPLKLIKNNFQASKSNFADLSSTTLDVLECADRKPDETFHKRLRNARPGFIHLQQI